MKQQKQVDQKLQYLLTAEQALYFRDQLRDARAKALSDAEGFQQILFCIEKIGTTLSHKIQNLGKYEDCLRWVTEKSALALEIPTSEGGRDFHIPFTKLYRIVREARNEALHHGAFARHLTLHATQLALMIEDGLMQIARNGIEYKVSDFMVRAPLIASSWQPISLVRQQMLANSFT